MTVIGHINFGESKLARPQFDDMIHGSSALGRGGRQAYIVSEKSALRSVLRRSLISAGILTEEFNSAEAFLAEIGNRPLGIVLLDVRLPGINGLELLGRLKNEEVQHPVIMVSSHDDIPTALGAAKAGALDFIEAPFCREQLVGVTERAFAFVSALQQSRSGKIETLTPREREVLIAFADGKPIKAVAKDLDLSARTVEVHRANIIRKLDVGNFLQALYLAQNIRLPG